MSEVSDERYEEWKEYCKKVVRETGYRKKAFYSWMLSKANLITKQVSPTNNFVDNQTWVKCYQIYKHVQQDNDFVGVITGAEGGGKSHLAKMMAAIIDPFWGMDKLLYTPEQLPELFRRGRKGDVLILDEGNLFLMGRDSATSLSKYMLKMFALMRQRNMVVFVCVPNFFTIDTYIREHRCKALWYLTKRGRFNHYNKKAVGMITLKGMKSKKVLDVNIPYHWFYKGACTSKLPASVNEKEYIGKKHDNWGEFLDELQNVIDDRSAKLGKGDDDKKNKEDKETDPGRLQERVVERGYLIPKQVGKELGETAATVRRKIKEGKYKGIIHGNNVWVAREETARLKEKLVNKSIELQDKHDAYLKKVAEGPTAVTVTPIIRKHKKSLEKVYTPLDQKPTSEKSLEGDTAKPEKRSLDHFKSLVSR